MTKKFRKSIGDQIRDKVRKSLGENKQRAFVQLQECKCTKGREVHKEPKLPLSSRYYTIRSKKELIAEKPQNIEKMSVAEMCEKYPKDIRRKYPPCLEVLKYWETEFDLDWGEPECFACKCLPVGGRDVVINSDNDNSDKANRARCARNYQLWSFDFEQCHLVSACFGGPAQPWNIVYLCSWCHRELDHRFSGRPEDYYREIEWLKMRNKAITKTMWSLVETNPNYEKVCNLLSLENAHIFLELMESKDAEYIKYLEQNQYSTIFPSSMENSVMHLQYALNEFPNKVRQKYGKSLIRHRPVRVQNCL